MKCAVKSLLSLQFYTVLQRIKINVSVYTKLRKFSTKTKWLNHGFHQTYKENLSKLNFSVIFILLDNKMMISCLK